MTKKIVSVDDLEVGKYYCQGKKFYFCFLRKDHFGDAVGTFLDIRKGSVQVEQEQEMSWLFSGDKEIKEVSFDVFFKAFDKALKRIVKIRKNAVLCDGVDRIITQITSKASVQY